MPAGLPDTNAKLADVIAAVTYLAEQVAILDRRLTDRAAQVDAALAELRSMRKPGPR